MRTASLVVTENGIPPYARGRHSHMVKTVSRQEWSQYDPSLLTLSLEEFGEQLAQLFERMGLGCPKSPAGLAWRLFRSFLKNSLPQYSESLAFLGANSLDTYVIRPPRIPRGTGCLRIPYVYIYDKRAAYASYLRTFPDLSTGSYHEVSEWAGPWGIYETHQGIHSGYYLARHPERHASITRGVAWQGDSTEPSPFQTFCDFCLGDREPEFQGLIKHLPNFVVGKMWRHIEVNGVWEAQATTYPLVWCCVIGGLQDEIESLTQCEGGAVQHAFVDSIHLTHPFDPSLLGPNPGQWRLVAEGPAIYYGLNRFQIGHDFIRHAGQSGVGSSGVPLPAEFVPAPPAS